MRKQNAIIILLFALSSCMPADNNSTKEKDIKVRACPKFKVETKNLNRNSVLADATYFNGIILCRTEDHELVVLDAELNYVDSLTLRYTGLIAENLYYLRDTVIIENKNGAYFLTADLRFEKYAGKIHGDSLFSMPPLYSDSQYRVYNCSAGEFGGSIYFADNYNVIYNYPIINVTQVVRFKGEFVIANYLSHWMGISSYLTIKDPSRLFLTLPSSLSNHSCYDEYTPGDSLSLKYFDEVTMLAGVTETEDTSGRAQLPVFMFEEDNQLYSIFAKDMMLILSEMKGHRFVNIDTLLNIPAYYQKRSIQNTAHTSLAVFKMYWTTDNQKANGNYSRYKQSGLIFRKGNSVKLLKWNVPTLVE